MKKLIILLFINIALISTFAISEAPIGYNYNHHIGDVEIDGSLSTDDSLMVQVQGVANDTKKFRIRFSTLGNPIVELLTASGTNASYTAAGDSFYFYNADVYKFDGYISSALNGTVGATTPSTGAFTTLDASTRVTTPELRTNISGAGALVVDDSLTVNRVLLVEGTNYVTGTSILSTVDVTTDIQLPIGRPASPVAGSFYYATGTDSLYIYNGSAWKAIVGL